MVEKRFDFLARIKDFVKGVSNDKTKYFRRPNAINEYARVGIDNGHVDIADRIFEQEKYYNVLKKVEAKIGVKIEKWKFLIYAGYILVDEGGKNGLLGIMGQNEIKELVYCTYSLSKENLDFVKSKGKEWENHDPIIADMYDSNMSESEKERIRKIVDLIKLEIEKARINSKNQSEQNIQGG